MSLFILAPDPNGTCCDCASRVNVCDSCSLFLVPIGTEVDHTGYADLATAQAVLDAQMLNCVAFSISGGFPTGPYVTILTGVGSISFDSVGYIDEGDSFPAVPGFAFAFALNLVAGNSVNITISIVGTGPQGCHPLDPTECSAASVNAFAYTADFSGTQFTTSSNNTGTTSASANNSFTVPYSGKYVFVASTNCRIWGPQALLTHVVSSVTVTSTGMASMGSAAVYHSGSDLLQVNCTP